MTSPIVVINPNSTRAVTDGIDRALDPLRFEGGPGIECVTLEEGPPGIESQAQSDAVVEPICRLIRSRENGASAFVIACFSDPGLHAARETTSKPVFGIAESAMVTALTRGERFGIVSILETSIPRHARAVRAAGLEARFAGDVAVGVGVVGLSHDDSDSDSDSASASDSDSVYARMLDCGRKLRDDYRADVVILGCAGMARFRSPLEADLGRPVIDPTQAAVTLAIGAVRLLPSS